MATERGSLESLVIKTALITTRVTGTCSNSDSGLTRGRLLARNSIVCFVGETAPLALGLVAIPLLLHALGADRYGILTLAYVVVGYLGLFDLGLGRAATQQISNAIGSDEPSRIPQIFWTSMIVMLALGIGAGAVMITSSQWLVNSVLKTPMSMRAESAGVFVILGTAMPLILSGSCLTGTLASLQRFDLTATIGGATGVYSFAAPLSVVIFTHKLTWIVLALALGRIGAWAVSLALCLMLIPDLRSSLYPSSKSLISLLSFGGWITVSGLASPLMANLDRVIIGSAVSVAAVTYYSVPFQIVNKLVLLPGAMSSVLFPAFSLTTRSDPGRASAMFERTSRYSLLALFPPVMMLFCLTPEVLELFFGGNMADHGSSVMRWLLIGVLVNGLALIPYGLVQAANRPDLTAKFHLAECPLYFGALFLLLPRFGIAGAAAAWTIRVIADTVALFAATTILLPPTRTVIIQISSLVFLASGLIACSALMHRFEYRLVFAFALLLGYAAIGWRQVLDQTDRMLLRRGLNSFRGRIVRAS